MKTNPFRLGSIFGLFLGLCHAFWAMFVALGWAQPITDFVFWAHFITPPWHIEPFALGRAGILVGFTFTVGLAMGIVGGWLWNRFAAAA
jgi:hypothetical protein